MITSLCLPLLWAQETVGRGWHPGTNCFLRITSTPVLKPNQFVVQDTMPPPGGQKEQL